MHFPEEIRNYESRYVDGVINVLHIYVKIFRIIYIFVNI